MNEKLLKISNAILSVCAGLSSFVFTLMALLILRGLDEQILAALTMGTFALLIVWIAAERPNTRQARAIAALIKRLLAVRTGDFTSPAPPLLRKEMPPLADAVETLFDQVRSNIDQVQAMALHDPVTSLPNRLYLKREGERLLAALPPGEQAALLFLDLDGFKEVNDSLGHARGDEVLQHVSDRFRAVVEAETRSADGTKPILARLSGDEFTLLLPAREGALGAHCVATKVLASLDDPFDVGSQRLRVGASIGVALWPDHARSLPELMKAADAAMYHAKANGRARVSLYDDALAAAVSRKADIEKALRAAIVRKELSLVFQPEACASTGTVIGAEALLCWRHPEWGFLSPGEFVPIAEESTLIHAIGDFAVEAALDTLRRWHDRGLGLRLAVNVSARQLERPEFFAKLREAIARTGAPASCLEIEVAEAAAMQWSGAMVRELGALRREGISLAIDDFGLGYSNFSRLSDMPVDRVKLERSLTGDVDASDSARTIAASAIHLMHGLGLEVVGQGVERAGQADVLRAVGCDLLQGGAIGEAVSEERFLASLPVRETVRVA